MVVPIMAKATRYQGEVRFPVKKVSLVTFFEVKYETAINMPKKVKMTKNTMVMLISKKVQSFRFKVSRLG